MEPEPHDDAGTTGAQPEPNEKPNPEGSATGEAPDPGVEDDGSVLEKQIQRWKNEGGSVLPPG